MVVLRTLQLRFFSTSCFCFAAVIGAASLDSQVCWIATWRGSNLFGKAGPNLDLGVGLVLFLGLVYMLV